MNEETLITIILLSCLFALVLIFALTIVYKMLMHSKGVALASNDEDDDKGKEKNISYDFNCITVYSSTGEPIKQFKGPFEIDEEEDGHISFTNVTTDEEYSIYTSSGTIIMEDSIE